MLGVPETDSDLFIRWIHEILELGITDDVVLMQAVREMAGYFAGHIADRRDNLQLHQALRGSEPRFFGPATRFQNLMKHLDFPAQGVPAKLFNGSLVGLNRQVGDQLPINSWSIGRLFALLGMEHGQGERRITLLLSDRRQHVNASVSDLDSCVPIRPLLSQTSIWCCPATA